MMEYKFRAWDTEGNNMLNWATISTYRFNRGLDELTILYQIIINHGRRFITMQYIGAKDMYGQDIYDGDIGELIDKYGRKIRFEVKYDIHRRRMDSGNTVDIPSFAFVIKDNTPTFPIVTNYLNKHDLEIMMIIGNIYENPELLKQ